MSLSASSAATVEGAGHEHDGEEAPPPTLAPPARRAILARA